MGGSSKMGGGLSFQQIREAFTEALIAAGGGGGGGGETFPDSTVQGSALFAVPVGFNAVARTYTEAGKSIIINGNTVSSSSLDTWQTMYPTTNVSIRTPNSGGGASLQSDSASNSAGTVGSLTKNSAFGRSFFSQTYKILEGDTIQITGGGSGFYHLELYAI